MEHSRRNFFEEILASGGLAALLAESAAAQSARPSDPTQVRTSDYWGGFYETGRGGPKQAVATPGKDVRYLFYDGKGLKYTDQLKKEDLLDHPGDLSASVSMLQFRPGTEDSHKVRQLTSSQLRIDCIQTKPFLNLLAPAAWVALASIYTDSAGKLPSLQQLGFQQPNLMSGENKIILPGGSGKFAVNVSSMTKESMLHKILRNGVSVAGTLSPLIGFPAMSLPAAKAFTAIYSLLEERASFFMSSNLMEAAGTQQAVDRPGFPTQYVPLKSGQYVMVPVDHTKMLDDTLPYLQLNQGYLIDSRKSSNMPVDRQAPEIVPDVTYLTLKLDINTLQLPLNMGDSSSSASEGGGDGGGGGGGGASAPKKSSAPSGKKK